jgi:acetoin utilization protein AcuC
MGDPLSSLELSNSCLWDAVMALTETVPACVVLGGGGYNPWTVARCWTGLWGRIAGKAMPEKLPAESVAYLESLECDLVDDEDDMQPWWTTTLVDPRNDGPVRREFGEIAEAVLAP